MISKDTKRIFFLFSPYECAGVEEYLEVMAKKGWLLTSIKGNFMKFKRIEPKTIRFSVDVLNKVSIFDHTDSDAALGYREYCREAGWNYVCERNKIQIFYTESDKNTISIHTDEEEKFISVFKASLLNVGYLIFMIIMFAYILYLQLFRGSTDYLLTSNFMLFGTVIEVSFLFISIIEVTSFFLWAIKARKKVKENKCMPYNNYRQLRTKNIFKDVYSLLVLIIFLNFLVFDNQGNEELYIILLITICISIIIMVCVQKLIYKKKHSKNTNMAMIICSFIVSMYILLMFTRVIATRSIKEVQTSKVQIEKSNLSLIDFGYKENSNEAPNINFYKSVLAQMIQYYSTSGNNTLTYTIVNSQYPWVIKFDENRLVSRFNSYGDGLKLESTNLPNAIKVYSDSKKRSFILVSENKVVNITKDFTGISDDEFLDKVYKKLLFN